MHSKKVALRYARALLNLAINNNELEDCYLQIKMVLSTIEKNKDLRMFLKSPVIKKDKKKTIFKLIFADKINKTIKRFLNLVVQKNRERVLYEILQSFTNLYNEYNNIEIATVTTSHPLDSETREMVLTYIKSKGKSRVELHEKIDKAILGGIIINMGGKQLNASLIKSINELKQSFSINLYEQNYLNKQLWEK